MNHPVPQALLDRDISDVAVSIGGTGRAHGIWRCLREGRPPQEGVQSQAVAAWMRAQEPSSVRLGYEVVSHCGTRKLLVTLSDRRTVETVLIPSGDRLTVCVSSQVGCARGCIFCATGMMGLLRSLTREEIVGQVVLAVQQARQHRMPELRNVVFMGMGEPLDNLDAVRSSLSTLTHPFGFALGKNHVSVSTVGTSPRRILEMVNLPAQVAWSVHAAIEDTRSRLVPTARHSVTTLRDAFADLMRQRQDDLFVEVTLIHGVNDQLKDANALARLFENFPVKVRMNLLPANDGAGAQASDHDTTQTFARRMRELGFFCSVRKARGTDVAAACGQLSGSGTLPTRTV